MLSRLRARFARSEPDATDPGRVLDSLDLAVLVVDAGGHILAANRHWHHLNGGLRTRLFHEYLHPSDRALWQQALLQLDSPVRLRLLLPTADDARWTELKLSPLHRRSPWPVSITLTNIDAQMETSRQKDADWRSLHQLVSQLPAMLYRGRNNRHWTMEFVSAGCFELTGYPPEVLTNQSCLNYGDLIHPEDAGPVWDQVQDALSRHTPFELHYRLQHADGRLIAVSEKGCGLYAENGAVLGVEGVVTAFTAPISTP